MNATLARDVHPATMLWRPLAEDDIREVALLERESHAAPWTAGNFLDALAAGYGMTVGVAGDVIVAYGVLLFAPGEAQILNLTVAPEARRRRLGRTLLRRLVAEASGRGATQCFLEVRESNVPAIALYAGEGFAAIARRIGYYPAGGDAREDALVMRKSLEQA
ncbi:MAG TPA: ribosomal protein S18-alanine N-acetyltransferase [Casimicrobiaceae bacterium]|nr:ribosomal protein S18-alanine N-acetyltransferase [Casimicrobiaceae bacterium]